MMLNVSESYALFMFRFAIFRRSLDAELKANQDPGKGDSYR